MKQELADKIINKCPELFSDLKYIEAPDGWFDLLNKASFLIEEALKSLPLEVKEQIKAAQIKEKFGGLRYYCSGSTPYINGVIAMAESMSYKICEKCSSPGHVRTDGWARTLCDTCFEERKKHA